MKSLSKNLLTLALSLSPLGSVLHAASPVGSYPHVPPVQGYAAGLSVDSFQSNYTFLNAGEGFGKGALSAFIEKKDALRAEFGYMPSYYFNVDSGDDGQISTGFETLMPAVSVSVSGSLPTFYGHDFWLGLELIRGDVGDGSTFMINQYSVFL